MKSSPIEAASSQTPWSRIVLPRRFKSFCPLFCDEGGNGSGQRVIGFICFRNVIEESELLDIAVHPDYRRRGIGKKLMQFYIDFSRRRESTRCISKLTLPTSLRSNSIKGLRTKSRGQEKILSRKSDALLMKKRI